MTVEKCSINIEDQEMLVYFNDGKKIEEQIESLIVLANIHGYTCEVHVLRKINSILYCFYKRDKKHIDLENSDIALSFDWGEDGNKNTTLQEVYVTQNNVIKSYIELDIESSYKDVEEVFDCFVNLL